MFSTSEIFKTYLKHDLWLVIHRKACLAYTDDSGFSISS